MLPRGEGLAKAARDAVPGGVDAVFDTALLGRGIFPAIRDGGALVFVRTWDGEDVEGGITIHPVWVGDVLERTDWLRELSRLAGRACSRYVSPRRSRPNGRQTRTARWRPAACAAAPSWSSTERGRGQACLSRRSSGRESVTAPP